MKHLIPLVMLLVLFGCDGNSPESQHRAKTMPSERISSEQGTVEKLPDYLDKPLQGKVSQRGLYRMVRSGGVVNDAKTTTGKVISNPVIQQIKSTERIPLVKGAQMYLQYKIWPFPNQPAYVDLRRVLKHPEMKLPDGSVSTGSDFMVKRKVSSNHVIVYTGYGFDEDYELIEGDWVFEIWYKDEKLIEQKFTTYMPDEEEMVVLKPELALGNQVFSKMGSPNNPNHNLNWPRVIVEQNKKAMPAGVSEAIRTMDKPIMTP